MEKQQFEEKLQSVNRPELEQMECDILDEHQNCLANLLLYSSAITCFIFHISASNKASELTNLVRDIKNCCTLSETLQYQLKCVRKQIEYIEHAKKLI